MVTGREALADDFKIPPEVDSIPAADIHYDSQRSGAVTTTQTFKVFIPKSDAEDFVINVRASQLREAIHLISEHERGSSSGHWSDLCLAGSTLLAGTSLSSLTNPSLIVDNALTTIGVFHLVAFPTAAVALFFGFLMLRQPDQLTATNLCNSLKRRLPNPDDAARELSNEFE